MDTHTKLLLKCSERSKQSMKPTPKAVASALALLRYEFRVFATLAATKPWGRLRLVRPTGIRRMKRILPLVISG